MTDAFFSREEAAGYDPDVLANSVVLVVGAGALGQNTLPNLALSQVGTLLLNDFDRWETHNATRSPFFPTDDELKRWGDSKVAVTAHKLKLMTRWSSAPVIKYATKPIQALGDAPFREADLVVSAVDNQLARNYLGLKTSQFGIPLVEGGFSGSHVNSTVLLNTSEGPCWNCNLYERKDRNRVVQLGCTAVARKAEEAGYVPAIQSAAAYLGAFMSEMAIQLLHGSSQLSDVQVVMDMRAASSSIAKLRTNPECPCHPSTRDPEIRISVTSETSCRELLQKLTHHVSHPVVSLPTDYVIRVACAECKHSIEVNEPDWVMSTLLFCRECGGRWNRIGEPGIEIHSTLSRKVEPLLDLPISKVGIVPRSLLKVQSIDRELLCELRPESYQPSFTTVLNGEKACHSEENTNHVSPYV